MKTLRRAIHQHWQYEPATERSCVRCREPYYASKYLPICLKCVGCDKPNPGPYNFARARRALTEHP